MGRMDARPRVAPPPALGLAAAWLAIAATTGAALFHAAEATAQSASSPSPSTTMASTSPGGYFTYNQLKPLAGERIGAWKRTDVNVGALESRARPMAPQVICTYRKGKQNATLTLSDSGAIAAASDAAQWRGPPNRRETAAGKEYVYREGNHTVREIEKRDPPGREVVLMLTNGMVVSAAAGVDVDMAALKALADGVSIAQAQSLIRPAE
jgi:hypothetical protein